MIRSAFRVSFALVIITLAAHTSRSQTPVVDHGTGHTAAESSLQRGSEKWQQLLDERQRHGQETRRLRGEGQIAEAIAACEKMLALERKLFQALAADKTIEAAAQRRQLEDDVAGSLAQLGAMHLQRDDSSAARKSWEEAFSIRKRLLGERHWKVTDARLGLENVQLREKLSVEQRQRLVQAEQWHQEGLKEHAKGQVKQAVDFEDRALNARREILGLDHPEVAAICEEIALIFSESNVLDGAEDFYRQAIRIRERRMGKTHPRSLKLLESLADVLDRRGAERIDKEEFADAVTSLGEALAIRADRFGAEDWRARELRVQLTRAAKLATLTKEQRQELAQASQLNGEGLQLSREKKYEAAAERFSQALEIRQKLLGANAPETLISQHNLALMKVALSDYVRAEMLFRESVKGHVSEFGVEHPQTRSAMELFTTLLEKLGSRLVEQEQWEVAIARRREVVQFRTILVGEQHWQVTDARLAVADAVTRSKLTAEDHQSLREADLKAQEALTLYQKGQFEAAVAPAKEVLEVRRRLLGEKHPDYAKSLGNLAEFYREQGDYVQAEPLYQQARDIRKAVQGEKHPDYAISLDTLASLCHSLGNYAQAEALSRQALDILKTAYGEMHPSYTTILNNLAAHSLSQGDYAQAEPLYRQARDIRKAVLGEKHPSYATSLDNLAVLFYLQADYAQAEPLYRQARDIRKAVQGENHPDYAHSLNNLAQLYRAQGDYLKAAPFYFQALRIRKAILGEKHPSYAESLINLAAFCRDQGEYAHAESLLKQGSETLKAVLGEKHPDYATSLDNHAYLYGAQGDYVQAETLYRQARDIRKAVLGDKHPHYAVSLNNLGCSLLCRLDAGAALPLARLAAEIERVHVEATAAVQSDRQQFLMLDQNRNGLDLLLTCDVTLGTALSDDYGEVLHAKGRVWQRQLATRAVADRPELATLFDELRLVSARRAKLTLDVPDPTKQDVWRRQLNELAERQEVLERDLSAQSATFRAARQRVTLNDLRKQLPTGTAAVDCFEYGHMIPAPGQRNGVMVERRLVAFVIRADSEVVRIVPLGQVEPLSQAIDEWRKSHGQSPTAQEAGQLLRQKIWEPLVPHLKAAKLVLFSPDGVLGRFPLAALPGKEPENYLLEEVPLVVIPCVMALPQMLASDSQTPRLEPSGNLLVVGDVDYRATSEAAMPDESTTKKFGRKQTAVRSSEWKNFAPLPGTRGELASIEKLYREIFGRDGITLLEKAQAREERFKEEAVKHKYLHVATHGFFAPPSLKSMLQQSADQERFSLLRSDNGPRFLGHPPGLLSGLAFAGANKTPELDKEDGILTASEVENLDLRGVQLAVLSACETGLGEVAGGEGLLGLQRAFQVAGAQTVVASLWQVQDNATRALMERFYDNLLKKEMSALESLREAQLSMLRGELARGLEPVNKPVATEALKRASPFFWAAFVLSGDWR